MRVLLMVSKLDHCLSDLLYRHHKGELYMQITAVVSNHLDLRPLAKREGIRNHLGKVVAAINLSGREVVMDSAESQTRYLDTLIQSAARISAELGA